MEFDENSNPGVKGNSLQSETLNQQGSGYISQLCYPVEESSRIFQLALRNLNERQGKV